MVSARAPRVKPPKHHFQGLTLGQPPITRQPRGSSIIRFKTTSLPIAFRNQGPTFSFSSATCAPLGQVTATITASSMGGVKNRARRDMAPWSSQVRRLGRVVFNRAEADFLLSICNACAAFWVLAGAFWTLIERFGEAFVVFREELETLTDEVGVSGEASGTPGEANFEDVRGVWDI